MKRFIAAGMVLLSTALAFGGDPWRGHWIWDTPGANAQSQPAAARYFRKVVNLEAGVNQDHTLVMVDNRFQLYVNGHESLSGSGWWPIAETDLSPHLHAGRNVIAIEAVNEGGPAGLYFESNLKNKRGELINLVSDATWRCFDQPEKNWTTVDFDDSRWKHAVELGTMGLAPWGAPGKPGDASARPAAAGPLPGAQSIKLFTMTPGFELRLVAEEPDVINPVAMAIDDKGRLFVSEAHTYRYGPEGSPVKPATNPIVMLEIGQDGKAHRKITVAEGYEDPIMGLAIRGNKIWIATLNALVVADLNPDGTAGPQKVLVKDVAKPWNPFGFYRVAFGPDGWLYLIIGDHEIELTGTDGRRVKNRGSTGALVRCKPDGTGLQLLTQGVRAPFSFDFDPFGHIWVLSNGEGNPNRLLMMVPGLDYHFQTRHGDWAWLAGTHPWSPPVTEMERGANTQVHCYLDAAFPERFWGQLFVANWGAHGYASVNHKIDIYSPDARGQIQDVSVFASGADPMFRPTQLVPDADGNFYMLDWYGRDDENDLTGRIYRIVATTKPPVREPLAVSTPPGTRLTDEQIRRVQNLSSPKSSDRERAANELVANPEPAIMGALAMRILPDTDPFTVSQVLWALRRIGTGASLTTEMIAFTCGHHDPRIRAMAVRLLRDIAPTDLSKKIEKLAFDPDPEVRVEFALCQDPPAKVVDALMSALDAGAIQDRRLRYQCAAELSRRMSAEQFIALVSGKERSELKERVGWIALDVALLEKTNPVAKSALNQLLETPGTYVGEVLTIAERWAEPDQVPALQKLLTAQIAGGGSGANIAAAFNVLRRFGPAAIEGVSADAQRLFFEQVAAGNISLPTPADRLAALKLLATVDAKDAGPRFVVAMLADRNPEVRLEALRTVRLIGWQSPDLFESVWTRLNDPALDLNERLTAIVSVGRQEKPGPARWKELLGSSSPQVVRTALRVCKQFAGNDIIRDMLLAETPRLIAAHPGFKDEIASLLSLFSIEPAKLAEMKSGPPLAAQKPEEIEKEMLAHLDSAQPRLGQDVFERVGCIACHDVSGQTQLFGPALKDIGKGASPASIAESILFPSRVIKDGFDTQVIRTKDGQELEGWVEQHGAEVIVVRGGAERVRVQADQVVERRKLGRSPMPDVTLDGLCVDELSDLLAYLVSQGGHVKTAAGSQPAATPRASARRPGRKH